MAVLNRVMFGSLRLEAGGGSIPTIFILIQSDKKIITNDKYLAERRRVECRVTSTQILMSSFLIDKKCKIER